MAPIISTLAAGSFRTLATAQPEVKYVSRGNAAYDPPNSVPSLSGSWGHSGGNSDAITIQVSGTGTYQLNSFSIGGDIETLQISPLTFQFKIYSGNTLQANSTMYTQSYSISADTSSTIRLFDLGTPQILTRGNVYTLAYGFPTGTSWTGNKRALTNTEVTTSPTITTANGSTATVQIGTPTWNDSDPFGVSNGTAANAGQFPVIGITI